MTRTCTVCGQDYEPLTTQGGQPNGRHHCYRPLCMREWERRRHRRDKTVGTCAVCGGDAHPERTCAA